MSADALLRQMRDRAELFRMLVDRFGIGILNTVAEWTSESARRGLAEAQLESRGLDAVMEFLWDQMVEGTHFDVVERTGERLELRVSRCLFADEMKRLDAANIGSAFYCAYDEGFCKGLNPAMRFSRTKTLMAGDDCCNHTYELTEETGKWERA